ncbi:hypothetical protein C356_06908 [Cryptococcus neoformans c45]|nr:hypothetical protein C356_06908 [Cryptococcus neoformans var. grubii c45]
MEDIIATIILISAVYFFVKWLIGTKPGNTSDGGIRGVTPSMVETVHSAFPHVPVPNIVYHLSRTRSAQATSEEILERGVLPPPPPTFNIPASLIPTATPQPAPTPFSNNANNKASNAKTQSLIDRYNLSSRLPSHKGKEKAEGEPAEIDNKWEESKEKRELGLKERKERMILEARKRMLEKQAKEQATN